MRGIVCRGRVGAAALALGLVGTALAGCSVVTSLTSTPTITAVTPRPDSVTPTVPPLAESSAPAAAGAAAPAGAATPTRPTRPSRPAFGPLQSTERLVIVDDLGMAFGAPTLFMEYDPKVLLDGAADSPMLKELAGRLRMNPDQLRTGVLNQVDRILVGGPVAGGPSNIVVARVPLTTLPPIPALRVQLKAVLGREIDTVRAVRTPAGPGTLVTYTLVAGGRTLHGSMLYVSGVEGLASITVTSASPSEATALTGRVLKTVRVTD
jgi:hypothetical protein